jgi:hypothetical protein
MYEDEENRKSADRVALDSYAILRTMTKNVSEVHLAIIDNFDEIYKLEKLIGGLTKLVDEMKEDDILVWTMG